MEITVDFRDLQPGDLADLDWTGGPAHQQVLADSLTRSWSGEVEVLVGQVGGWRLVACGGLDLTRQPGVGWLWMLIVHEAWRNLGLGSALVAALEERCLLRGLPRARLGVEYDNPEARRLYESLGYRSIGPGTDSWPTEQGRRTVAVELLEHTLTR